MRAALALAVALVVLAAAPPAPAASGPVPRLALAPATLDFSEPGDTRALTLTNVGDDVLRVGALSVVMFDQLPAVEFQIDAPAGRELEPGASATINVTFHAPAGVRPRQAFAAVLIPADDPTLRQDLDLRTGAPIARRLASVPLRVGQSHELTWMIVVPLFGLLLLGVGPLGRSRHARLIALAAAGVPLAVAAFAATRFDPAVSVEDGNLGLQLVAHVPLVRALGFEYFVGVDGTSVLYLLLAPLVGVAAVVAARALPAERQRPTLAAVLLVQAAATGLFAALDGALFWTCWLVASAGLVALVGARVPRASGRPGPSPFALAAGASALLLLVGLLVLRAHAGPSYLADGTPVAHTFDLTKLARVGLAARLDASGPLAGLPASVIAAAALFAAFALALPLFPFQGWVGPTFERASVPAALAVAGLYATMGAHGLLRVGVRVLPTVAGAAAPLLAVLGALGVLHAALLALGSRDPRRLVAHAGGLQMTFCLLGFAALSPAGVAGGISMAFAHGLGAVLIYSLLGALSWAPRGLASFEGLGMASPRAALWLAFALLASFAAPGLATFVGPALVLLDVATAHPIVALAALASLALSAAAHVRFGKRIFAGAAGDDMTPALAIAPLDDGALVLIVPVAALLVGLGLAPAPMLDAVGASVLDLVRVIATPLR